ncbi:MAG: hypothetical protein J7496_13790 [Novosphingobium sp.]|nr:hypothetical protein [Novosphingobium sp.]MBO9603569.1 hypothetical protein [Novosphingobium sp.]
MKRALCAAAILLSAPAVAQYGSTSEPHPPAQPNPGNWTFDPARAQRNYERVLSGQIALAQLSPQEFAEVKALDDYAREKKLYKPDKRTSRQRCLDEEIAKAGRAPSRLELKSIDLKCGQI